MGPGGFDLTEEKKGARDARSQAGPFLFLSRSER